MSSKALRACDLTRTCECALARTEAVLRELRLSGRCQSCRDAERLACHPSDPRVRYRVRTGALAAMSGASGVAEFAFLPFRWTVPGGPFAWDTQRIVRVGAWLAPIDWTHEWAGAMEPVLAAHHFRFHEFRRFEGEERRLRPLLGDVELLVGVNVRALSRVQRSLERICSGALGIGIEEAHERTFGHPLGRLGAFVVSHGWTDWSGAYRATPSALRLVSWIGAVLSMRAGAHWRFFDLALDTHRDALGLVGAPFGPGLEACAVPALDPR